MKVIITDPEHPYHGLTGKLESKRKVAGRVLRVVLDDYLMPTEVSKTQVKVIAS